MFIWSSSGVSSRPFHIILYVNDLPDLVENKIKLFADDLKLIRNAANHSNIAENIEELEVWESISEKQI